MRKERFVELAYHRRFAPICLALILVLITATVSEGDCVQDALANIDQAVFLVMASGAVYRVTDKNGVEIAFWLPPAGVVICDQVSMSGELYYAISNQDVNQTVFAVRER